MMLDDVHQTHRDARSKCPHTFVHPVCVHLFSWFPFILFQHLPLKACAVDLQQLTCHLSPIHKQPALLPHVHPHHHGNINHQNS